MSLWLKISKVGAVAPLVAVAFVSAAHAQNRSLQETLNKATVSINRAMNATPTSAAVVYDSVIGVTPSGLIILKARNRVLEVDPSSSTTEAKALLRRLSANVDKELAFEISANGYLKLVRPLTANEAKSRSFVRQGVEAARRRVNRPLDSQPRVPFAPTTVSTVQQANGLFYDVDLMNQPYMDLGDNCFNRSHYFARQNEIGARAQFDQAARTTSGTLIPPTMNPLTKPMFSEKIFVLFTDRYMKAFNHKWWYHTSPTVRVVKGGGHDIYVLDRSYMDQAVPRLAWLQAFASHAYQPARLKDGTFWDGSGCKPLTTLQDYYNGSQKEMCFYSENQNMYTYLPTDLQTPNALKDWRCTDFYNLIQGIPYPDPRRTSLGGLDYNTYVRSTDNQIAWMQYLGGKFMPQDCRPQ